MTSYNYGMLALCAVVLVWGYFAKRRQEHSNHPAA